jgi:hypothetical protein
LIWFKDKDQFDKITTFAKDDQTEIKFKDDDEPERHSEKFENKKLLINYTANSNKDFNNIKISNIIYIIETDEHNFLQQLKKIIKGFETFPENDNPNLETKFKYSFNYEWWKKDENNNTTYYLQLTTAPSIHGLYENLCGNNAIVGKGLFNKVNNSGNKTNFDALLETVQFDYHEAFGMTKTQWDSQYQIVVNKLYEFKEDKYSEINDKIVSESLSIVDSKATWYVCYVPKNFSDDLNQFIGITFSRVNN